MKVGSHHSPIRQQQLSVFGQITKRLLNDIAPNTKQQLDATLSLTATRIWTVVSALLRLVEVLAYCFHVFCAKAHAILDQLLRHNAIPKVRAGIDHEGNNRKVWRAMRMAQPSPGASHIECQQCARLKHCRCRFQ